MITRRTFAQIAEDIHTQYQMLANIPVITPRPDDVVFYFSEEVRDRYPFVVVDLPEYWPWNGCAEGAD